MSKDDEPIYSFPQHARAVKKIIDALHGFYRMDFARVCDQRSLSQNSYLHGVVFPWVAKGIQEAWGERCDAARAKRICKALFLKRAVCDPFGEVVSEEVLGTSDLDVAECGRFIDEVTRFALDMLGVTVPPPAHYETSLPPAPPESAGVPA